MIRLEQLIAHYEKMVMAPNYSVAKEDLEVYVSTLVHLSAYSQAKMMLEKLAGRGPVRSGRGG